MKEKSYKRIVLHAGLHKTGTTSIQDNCHKHRESLLQHGIAFPSFRLGGRLYMNHSDPLAVALTSKLRHYGAVLRMKNFRDPQQAGSDLRGQMKKIMENPKADTLLLSAELVCDFDERDMKALRRYLEQYTDNLEVVAVVRSPHHSVASIMQQRCSDGEDSNPAKFRKLVGERYERLRDGFGDQLRVINFHEAVKHPQGLVGCFLQNIGFPAGGLAHLELTNSNERVTMEAFYLMSAINRAFPRSEEKDHGIERHFRDMYTLHGIPGQPFQFIPAPESRVAKDLEEQRQWLEQELGMEFPGEPDAAARTPLWQKETLRALAPAINAIENLRMRQVAKKALEDVADTLESKRADTSAVLRFISDSIYVSEDRSTELILQSLGADYFKYAALQVEGSSTEMSLLLMELAQKLRPNARFIDDRVQIYRRRLQNSQSQES